MKTYTLKQLKQALIRSHDQHGHEYNCSAARGMDSDCTCGWTEIKKMVRELKGQKSQ